MSKIFIFSALFFITANCFSQITGEVNGKVIDRSNQQPLQDVSVSVLKNTIVLGGAVSDEKGFFKIDEIPVGEYSIRFSLVGFNPLFIDNIVVNSGAPADVLAELEIVSTELIEITEERFRNPNDISNSFKNLNYEEIRRSPGGFEDIGRVVQTLPGVSFVNDGRNDLIVRGGSPSENLFLVDNSVVPNINHFGSQGSTGGPISIINLELLREINFVTGGFSAKYGDKLSSILELKLREGSREKFLSDINLSATGFGAVFEGPIGSEKKGSWIFSARRSYLDLIFNASGFGFVPAYSSAQIKAVYDFNDKNSLTVNAYGNLDNVKFNNDTEENIQDNETILDNDQKGYVNTFELKSLLTKKSFALFNLGRTYNTFKYLGRDSLFNDVFRNNSKESDGDFITIKYNKLGLQLWAVFYDGPMNGNDVASSIGLDNFGNVYVSGSSIGNLFYYDYATVKYSPNGNEQWVRRYNGSSNFQDQPRSMIVDSIGNVFVTGNSTESVNGYDFSTIKYCPDGEILWQSFYHNGLNDIAYSIELDCLGNVYVSGQSDGDGTGDDFATVCYDFLGNQKWVKRYDYSGQFGDFAQDLKIDKNGSVFVTGTSDRDILTIKYSQLTGGETIFSEIPKDYSLSQNYPNPFNPNTIINYQLSMFNFVSIKVYDVLGNQVASLVNENKPAGRYEVEFDGSDFPSGIYFYSLSINGNVIDTKRMVLLK